MECTVHSESARETCSVCSTPLCEHCVTYDVDGNVECEACSAAVEERRRWLGAAVLAWIGVGYLAALAVAVLVFHKRPFVGGLAAIVALGLGRALQSYVHPPVISRRT